MKTPIRYWHGGFAYTGRIRRPLFDAWAGGPDGRPVIDAAQARVRFSLTGRRRAARRWVWSQISGVAQTDDVIAGMQREAEAYLPRLEKLVYANGLPRATLHLHRLVVVPRVFVNAEAYRHIDAVLRKQRAFDAIQRGDLLRGWFCLTLVDSLSAAAAAARPSPGRPLPAGRGWIAVGVNERFQWGTALDGPAWPGHYYVLELTSMPITRAVRKAAGEAIARLESALPDLSRSHRYEILRLATSSLEQLFARA